MRKLQPGTKSRKMRCGHMTAVCRWNSGCLLFVLQAAAAIDYIIRIANGI